MMNRKAVAGLTFALGLGLLPMTALAETTAFTQALATAASDDAVVAGWYARSDYAPLWTGPDDAARRRALLEALATAKDHGLPVHRYDADALAQALRLAETEGDRGRVEMAFTRAYLAFARDLGTGVLDPSSVDPGIVRKIDRIDPGTLLSRIASGNPQDVMARLVPKSEAYLNLMRAKIALEGTLRTGGWGTPLAMVPLEPGQTGPDVVALRDRLIRMGYLASTASAIFDAALAAAVQAFQRDHGLTADGKAGEATLAELNVPVEDRLKSVIVAMERERWMHDDRSARHIWVNLPDFMARIVEDGRTLFETRVVIGKNVPDQRTPEFSDQMDHMVINPSWGVPRSIIVKEYLPLLQQNPNAVGHLQVVDSRGRVIPRDAIDFAAYSERSFPFGLRQPPSDDNALGLVKFMFPNHYNIYLHDTPSKSLFDKEVRAYSHGCIRVADPFDLAYTLLSRQSADPKAEFRAALDSGRETIVQLQQTVPVHLVYFTAYPDARGRIVYRRDVYGRDAALYRALEEAGVALGTVQG